MTIPQRIARLDKILNECEVKVVYSIGRIEIRKAYWQQRREIQRVGSD